MDGSQIERLAAKLGITSQRTKRKANELLRLAEVRATTGGMGSYNVSGSCKAVICLDLAAQQHGETVDKASVIKLSGTTKKMYTASYKILENLLDLQTRLTLKDLAVKFGCTGSTELATKILTRYSQDHGGSLDSTDDESSIDFTTPLFQSAALYTACKHQKVKVDKQKMVEISSGKKYVFDKLVVEMTKLAAKLTEKTKIVSPGKRSANSLMQDVEKSLQDIGATNKQQKLADTTEEIEDYEVWKKRILENARKALAKQS
ncbi:unnamed protein product [Owenia fusiformis]|uniref:Origin recognition complex subunit 6 n=1 Tax=Owenia fusiformis TaxID=6347 RepID=A0A8S4NH46_OWEFU|nr:unnamed protein product [Owenia fusiformis]